MPIDRARVRDALKAFDFNSLFIEELGWDRPPAGAVTATFDGVAYPLNPVAHKRGMVVFVCKTDVVPNHATRQKIERQAAKSAHEHIIVYVDSAHTNQVWQWIKREPGRPSASRQHAFHKDQPGDSLIQKVEALAFELDEEESLTITGVAGRARQAFDVDRVTKRFFDRFKSEHAAFLEFVEGIQSQGDREWYGSLMLNRLMFIYFIQKKGFLDGDNDYLRNRLRLIQARKGKDKFHSFYRYFLLRLFHEGLGQEPRTSELESLLGTVPYFNGGLFDVHDLERANDSIEIADQAFEKIFDFFDAYSWNLDSRPLRADNEINPDVLGYIFEKYINQKQMGAYYTREDITEYMSKNTIVPRLLEEARAECEIAFDPGSALWRLLSEDPDRYIYEPARRGVESPLQPNIKEGIANVGARSAWEKPAAPEVALPTETWREHVARRMRYETLHSKLSSGEICDMNDLVTYNLNLHQWAQDIIDNAEGPELVRAFYRAIERITVLDPTCGSGAFLFAALNVLEPLYEACLDRMQAFVAEDELPGKKDRRPEHFADFRGLLAQVAAHPNRRYFVLKSIIMNNLFGVDIMEEAVEICKLRLFLKLVAQVDDVDSIEPLPDIDFNIRAGNTLVGFVDYDEARHAVLGELQTKMDLGDDMERIDQSARAADQAFVRFRRMQTEQGVQAEVFADAKADLRKRLHDLSNELDGYLGTEYGIDPTDGEKFVAWTSSYLPFHWFAEFYGIIKAGGFDVIIGNPPYVEYGAAVKQQYLVRDYTTLPCRNLHAFCVERSLALASAQGRISWIVPLPSINTDRMATLQAIVKPPLDHDGRSVWIAAFDERPSNLFNGVDQRLVIEVFGPRVDQPQLCTTGITRWAAHTRPWLFALVAYATQPAGVMSRTRSILKIKDSAIESDMLGKLYANEPIAKYRVTYRTPERVAYRTAGGRYWKVVLDTPFPETTVSGKTAYLDGLTGRQAVALISSSTFWWYYSVHFDMYNLKDYMIWGFPFSGPDVGVASRIDALGGELVTSLERNAVVQTIQSKTRGTVQQKIYVARKSKPIIDEIDAVLAQHYHFTDEELDFLVNYDIKYRLGAEDSADE